jgi:hypothetical protein
MIELSKNVMGTACQIERQCCHHHDKDLPGKRIPKKQLSKRWQIVSTPFF